MKSENLGVKSVETDAVSNYGKRGVINHVFISPYYSKLSRRQISDGSVIKSSGCYVEYAVLDNTKSSEYSLSNLIAIGAFDNLNYVSMSVSSDMNFVDSFSESYNTIKNDVSQVTKQKA